ncbi:MAG: hypothetical protein ACJ766_19710 [Thermoleophilaceae bacterium]
MGSDQSIYDVESTLLTAAVSAAVLVLLVRVLGRKRPGLSIGRPMAVAFAARVLTAAAVSLTSIAHQIRGPDELGFLDQASKAAGGSLTSPGSITFLKSALHVWVMSLQDRVLGDIPDLSLRMTQVGLAVAGLTLLSVAVYDLAGPGPARVAAWIVALEPAGVFFSSILHKEPLMFLAAGLVAYGGARLWTSGRLTALVPMAIGVATAYATRQYVGVFLAAAAFAIVLHASLTRYNAGRSPGLAVAVLLAGVLAIPVALHLTSGARLAQLQYSQNANATDSSNLPLERVDFSSRQAVVVNLPRRMVDVLTRPYPWQLANTSQRLGLIGTAVSLALLGLVLVSAAGASAAMQRAGPLVYIALGLLAAYGLSAGNAGTAFRYRTHVVAFLACLVAALWPVRAERRAARTRSREEIAQPAPILARS